MSTCPICLETISSIKASPDVCDHFFCLQCLTKWSKMESFCPVDRKRFRKIINLDTGTSYEIKRRGKKRKTHTLYDISAFCEVCKSGDKDDTLLLCDSCDLAYHCECLSPPLSAVPSGRWFCPVCNSIDKRLEQGEELTKKPREEPCQLFVQSSSCSISIQPSSKTVRSFRNDSTSKPINSRKNLRREEYCSERIQSISFPSASPSSQLNSVKVSKEDYQTLCAHSKSLFLAPGITVSTNRTSTTVSDIPNESHEISTSHCDSKEYLKSNSNVQLNLTIEKGNQYNIKNKEIIQDPTSTQSLDIEYKSPVSQLKVKKSYDFELNKTSNLLTSHSDSDKTTNHLNNQLSKVCVLKTLPGNVEKPESFIKGSDVEDIQESSDTSDCEIIYDGSNCITIEDKLDSDKCQHSSKISNVTSQAKKISSEASIENQSLSQKRPELLNHSLEEFARITPDYVSKTEDGDLPNLLNDFELRSSQYAAKAKMNLPRELEQIEEEKWKRWVPHKRTKANLGTSSNLLEVSQRKNQDLDRRPLPNSKQVFNIIDYTRRVKNGKHLHASSEILNKYKAFVAHYAEKSNSKPKVKSEYDLNVFQGPFSQCSFVHGGTKMKFMHVNPSNIPKEASNSNQLLKTYPTVLHRDFQDLSMREDGSLFLNWSIKC